VSRVAGAGEEFQVNLTLTGVTDLYGWQLELYYDSTLLSGIGVVEGPFLKSRGATYFMSTMDNEYTPLSGRMSAVCTLLIGNVSGVNGTGVLATVTFRTKASGNCLLMLSNTKLGNSKSEAIDHEISNGAVEILLPIHDVAVKNVTPSKSEVAEGRSVDVSVLVANEGNRTENFNVNLYANTSIVATANVLNLLQGTLRNLVLAWNTTGAVTNSSYRIKAEATPVADETDLGDNVFIDGFITVTQRNHDVSVDRVIPQRTSVFQGQKLNVTVAVANNGAYYETFGVTLYYDNATVETKNVANLPYGEQRSLTFIWETTGVGANKSYNMKAVAGTVTGETDILNNTFTDGIVTVLPREALSINITGVVPCNQLGQPISSFARGTLAYLKITVKSNSMNPEPLLLTINIYDAASNTIGVISFRGPTAPEETTFILGSPIPSSVHIGTATVYVNALTDWPHLGGVPYGPERTATFQITAG
jgi:hypothetical protein